ncbi:MAG: hypothetical protein U1E26_08080 [Coriobacteriia bacterium]|nr:hypothetical protein [Coriobacteriia bacterium]
MEDIQLLVQFDTVAESRNGSEYTFEIIPGTFEMNDEIRSTMDHLAAPIAAIAAERDINVLELAATFDYAKSLGRTDEEAYLPMRRKPCWSQQREESALLLLQQLGPQETDETRC